MSKAPKVDWRLAATCAAVVTALFTIQQWSNTDVPPLIILERQVIVWGVWLALSPFVIATSLKYPFWEGSRKGWLARHLLIGGIFSAVHAFVGSIFRVTLGIAVGDTIFDATVLSFFGNFGRNYLTYALLAASYQAIAYHYSVRERDARAVRLELDLAEAKLASLEGRMRPHFLFNTLNTIAALIRDDPRAAETMLGQLSDLLRASLRSDVGQEVPLDEELSLVEQYLAIQRVRFQDRLRISIAATDEARRAQVPQLIIQPIVENAVRHGIAPRETGGSVSVRAEQVNGRLQIVVEDDGVGMGNAPASQAGSGLGIGGLRSRLSHLFGADQRIEIAAREPAGTRVTIEIPYRGAAVTDAVPA